MKYCLPLGHDVSMEREEEKENTKSRDEKAMNE
jgi:hypothetical protein